MDPLELATLGFVTRAEGATTCRIMSQANLGIVPQSSQAGAAVLRPAPAMFRRRRRR
jgi:hypothetical protein